MKNNKLEAFRSKGWLTNSQKNLKEIHNSMDESVDANRISFSDEKETDKISLYEKIVKFVESNSEELNELFPREKENFNPNYCNDKGWSLLNFVIDSEDLGIVAKLQLVEMLIEYGININIGSTTPLHLAAMSGYYEMAEALIEAGAFVYALNFENKTPIDLAKEEEDEEMLKILNTDFDEEDMDTSGQSGSDEPKE